MSTYVREKVLRIPYEKTGLQHRFVDPDDAREYFEKNFAENWQNCKKSGGCTLCRKPFLFGSGLYCGKYAQIYGNCQSERSFTCSDAL